MDSTGNLLDAQNEHSKIPEYDKYGRRYEEEERKNYAQARGLCYPCGRVIFTPKVFGRKILTTNEDVYKGVCIRCHPTQVPEEVLRAWEKRNKPVFMKEKLRKAATKAKNIASISAASRHAHNDSADSSHNQRLSVPGDAKPSAGDRSKRSSDTATNLRSPDLRSSEPPASPRYDPQSDPLLGSKKKMNTSSKKVIASPKPSGRRPSESSVSSRHNDDLNMSQSSIGSRSSRKYSTRAGSGASLGNGSERSASGSAYYEDGSDALRGRTSNRILRWDDFEPVHLGLSSEQVAQRLEEHLDDVEALRKTLHAVRNEYDDGYKHLVGPIKSLMSQYDSNTRIMDVACGALWRMAADDLDAKRLIVDSGTIDLVVEAIAKNRYDAEFAEWAMGTVMSVAVDVGHKEYVSERNAIESILETLSEHEEKGTVFEWSCRCLYTLLVVHEDGDDDPSLSYDILSRNVASMEDFDGIPTIVEAMRRHERDSDAQNVAIRLLWRLLDVDPSTKRKTIRKLTEAGIVQLLTRLFILPSTSAGVFDCAAELLCTIFSSDTGDSSIMGNIVECIPIVVRRMERSPDDARYQKAGLRILAAAIVLGDVPVQKLEEDAGPRVVVEAMNLLFENPVSVSSGLLILWRFSSYSQKLLDHEVTVAALHVMRKVAASGDFDLERYAAIFGFVVNTVQTEGLQFSDIPVRELLDARFDNEVDEDKRRSVATESMPIICSQFPEFGNEAVQFMASEDVLNDLGEGKFESVLAFAQCVVVAGQQTTLSLPPGLAVGVVASIPKTNDAVLLKVLMDFLTAVVKSSEADNAIQPSSVQTLVTIFKQHMHDLELCHSTLNAMAHIFLYSSGCKTGAIDCRSVAWPILDCVLSSDVDDDTQEVASLTLWSLLANSACEDTDVLSRAYSYTIKVLEQFVGESAEAFEQDLVETTCGVLSSVAALVRSAPIPISQPDVDVLVSIIYLSMELSQSPMIPLLVLESLYHFCLLDEGVLIQCGAIVVVADSIQKFNNEPRVLEGGFALLAQLASSENIHINLSIVFSDGVDSMLHGMTLYPEHLGIQMYGCKAFSHLSIEGETRMVICEQGGLALIVSSLASHHDDQELAEYACSALLNLTSDSPEETINGTEIVDRVVQLLERYKRAPSIRRNCLGILQNISMKGPDAKASIASSGGLDAVIRTIEQQSDPPDVLERAFTTMWSLAVLNENRERIVQSGGIDHAVQAMLSLVEYEGAQQQACGCLCTLAMDPSARKAIRLADGCDALLYAMRVHFGSYPVQNEALRAISVVSGPDCEEGEMGVAVEILDAVLMAMRKFFDEETLQTRGCAALSSLLTCPGQNFRSQFAEIRQVVGNASDRFPTLAETAHQILSLLD